MKKYNVGWGITNACNMNCKFCYSKDRRAVLNDINIENWKAFIDQNYKYIDSINYGTGENAINDDFFYFVRYVRENYPSITQSLTTNGYISEKVKNNKEFYDIYLECIDEVDVSLDFALEEKHNYFRGQNKAYFWAIKTLEMLQKDHKKATIVFVGFDETLKKDNIDGLFAIAKEYDAIIRLNIYRPVSSSENINKKFILSYDKLKEALNYINNNYSIMGINDILISSLYVKDSNVIENTGVDSIRILPDGSICPSTYLITEKYGNKYHINDENVLKKLKFEEFEEAPIPEECLNCSIKDKCRGGVFDRRILWYGTLEKRDPYCPFNNNDTLPQNKMKVLSKKRISVHDGYLPTMFFKNKGE